MTIDFNQNMLLKFVEPEYTDGTLDGGLYFSRSGVFVDLEKEQLEKGIGDEKEGMWSSSHHDGEYVATIIDSEGNKTSIPLGKLKFEQTYSDLKKVPICCFTVLNLSRDFDVDFAKRKLTLKKEIQEKLIEQFEGRSIVLFKSFSSLIQRVDKALKKDELKGMARLVHYYDNEDGVHPISDKEFHEDAFKALLYKGDFFEFQKEFRFVIKKTFDKDYPLNIGSLRDIAINLGEVKSGQDIFPSISINKETK